MVPVFCLGRGAERGSHLHSEVAHTPALGTESSVATPPATPPATPTSFLSPFGLAFPWPCPIGGQTLRGPPKEEAGIGVCWPLYLLVKPSQAERCKGDEEVVRALETG